MLEKITTRVLNTFGCNSRGRLVFRSRLINGIAILVGLWLAAILIYYVRSLFPELDMIVFSNCFNPIQNWDGKILDVPVWPSSYANRPKHFNIHFEKTTPSNLQMQQVSNNRPVVIWGTHHKTGTFLAKKLFSRVCAKMGWCCLFHVTRDSVHAVTDALTGEPVNAVGHNQWIWHPRELNITNYYFIHFYRHPYKKIVSGYKYHYDGTEVWTQKPTLFKEICSNGNRLASQSRLSAARADPDDVYEYCRNTHLCQTCCRREHEDPATLDSHGYSQVLSFADKALKPRSAFEYEYMCEHLGKMNGSLQHTLQTLPETQGLLTEAALDYYENMRMAVLVNQTADDPRTLNIDLDYVTGNYHQAIWVILRHLQDIIPMSTLISLHDDLQFFDLNTSPVYRWSMSNPIINHVTADKGSKGEQQMTSKEMQSFLKKHPDVQQLYQPIVAMMHKVLDKHTVPTTSTSPAPPSK